MTPDSNFNRMADMAKLATALSSANLFVGYEETISGRYIATIEGDGGLSLSKWEPYIVLHWVFDDLQGAKEWVHSTMSDDWNAGTVLDTQSGTIVASAGMPLPSGNEANRVARVVRDEWVGAYAGHLLEIEVNRDVPQSLRTAFQSLSFLATWVAIQKVRRNRASPYFESLVRPRTDRWQGQARRTSGTGDGGQTA